ncbi:MAG: HI1506-related protein [Desulfobulbaceae bacterium]
MIRIVSKKEGFRRCGVAHPRGPVDYPDGHWTAEQLAALQAEPQLSVQIIQTEPPEADTSHESHTTHETNDQTPEAPAPPTPPAAPIAKRAAQKAAQKKGAK